MIDMKTAALAAKAGSVPATGMADTKTAFSGEEAAAYATVEKMTRSLQGSDLDGVLSSYEPDAVIVFEPGEGTSDQTVCETHAFHELRPRICQDVQ